MTDKKQYAVVGGGLAGLCAAVELGTLGHGVTLYEQTKTLGGRAATQHQQGYAMNLGPHGFYVAGLMKAQFDAWSIPYYGKPPVGNGNAHLIYRGRTWRFPGAPAALLSCDAFSMMDRLRLAAIVGGLKNARAREAESMQMWIERTAKSVPVQHFLGAMTRLSTYAADLDLLDANAALEQLRLAVAKSVLYLDGGWETLIHGLESKARRLGVVIEMGRPVVHVECGLLVLEGGERRAADGMILAMPPRAVEQVTGRSVPPVIPARAACLDLGLRKLPKGAGAFALGMDEATYVSVHSNYAGGLAPQGGALVQLAMYLKQGEACRREELEERADLILPGWQSELAYARFLPEMTVVQAIPRAGEPRPVAEAVQMRGVLVAGDWVGPDGMLADAAVASGVAAARSLVGAVAEKAA